MRADLLLSQPNIGRGDASCTASGSRRGRIVRCGDCSAVLEHEYDTPPRTDSAENDTPAGLGGTRCAPPQTRGGRPDGSGTCRAASRKWHRRVHRRTLPSGVCKWVWNVQRHFSHIRAGRPLRRLPRPLHLRQGDNVSSNATGNASAAPAADPNGDDGWKRVPFECNLTGTFPTLQDFLERLTRLPRVVEITGIELHRDRIDSRTGRMRVHLKLTGSVFGQDSKP